MKSEQKLKVGTRLIMQDRNVLPNCRSKEVREMVIIAVAQAHEIPRAKQMLAHINAASRETLQPLAANPSELFEFIKSQEIDSVRRQEGLTKTIGAQGVRPLVVSRRRHSFSPQN